MPYNTRLKIIKNDIAKYFDLLNLSQSIQIASLKNDYKIVDGNRQTGILQGIGLISAGRTLSFAIPIFESKEKKDIYKQIAEYTSILTNSYSYNFYIQHFINDIWYEAQVQITEVNGYTIDLTNNIKSFGFKCLMIDNNFLGDEITETFTNINLGLHTIEYKSLSLVPSNIIFEWNIYSSIATVWEGEVQHNDNYGLKFNASLGIGTFKISFDGNIATVQKQGEKDVISIEYQGVQPFLDVELNLLRLRSNYGTQNFIMHYRNGIAL